MALHRTICITFFLAVTLAVIPNTQAHADTIKPICSGSGWCWNHQLPQAANIEGIWVRNPNDVFAVGAGAALLRYDGSRWDAMEPPANFDYGLYAVWGSSATDVFAVGLSGKILRFDGTSWTEMTSGTSTWLRGVWGTGPNDVFAVGNGGEILHYDGSSWSPMVSGFSGTLYAVHGTASNDVYASGAAGTVLQYDGITWTDIGACSSANMYALWVNSSTDIVAAGASSSACHYDGSTWTSKLLDIPGSIFALWGTSGSDMYAVNSSGRITHYDGSAWTEQTSPTSAGLSALSGSGGGDIWAGGYGGTLVHSDGSTWSAESSGYITNATGYTVWGTSASDVWASFTVGWLLHYDGASWTNVSTGIFDNLTDVWGTATDDVFLVAWNGNIRHYDGSTWSGQPSGTTEHLYGLWGAGPGDVFAVGDNGTILHYNGGTWSPHASGTANSLQDVWGTSGTNVFAVGNAGTILHYDGSTWNSQVSCSGLNNNGVWGASATELWTVGALGTVCHTTDGGLNWLAQATPTTVFLRNVWGTSATNVYATGQDGVILHYDGSSWSLVETATRLDLQGIYGFGPNDIFVSSQNGGILRMSSMMMDACWAEPSDSPYTTSTFVALPENPTGEYTEILYQWKRNGSPIAGATHQRLEPQTFANDAIAVECTPTNGTVVGPTTTSAALSLQSQASVYTSAVDSGLWNMVSVPLTSGEYLTDDFTVLYTWDEVAQSYSGGFGPGMISNPGEGMWSYIDPGEVDADGGREMDATGAEVPAGDFDVTGLTVSAGTWPGRHFLGNPFNGVIDWSNVEVRQASSGSYVDIVTAAGNGWIENNIWMRYDNVAGQYLPLVGSGVDGTIFPWEGFWIRAIVDIDFRFAPGGGPPPPPVRLGENDSRNWTVTLSATAGRLRDDYNGFGVHADAEDGWDVHDATDGGTLNASHVVLTFDGGANDLAYDIRGLGRSHSWTAEVDAVDSGPVTLTWENVPSKYLVTLNDTVTGGAAIMNDGDRYTFDPGDSETRTFTITAERIDAVTTPEAHHSADGGEELGATGGGCMTTRGDASPLAPAVILLVGVAFLRRRW